MGKATILIVEDEEIVAADLAEKLKQLGYEVLGTTARGEEAIELACSLKPQVVLMDIRLKGPMDGIEASEAIRHRHCAPVIYLTSHSDTATLERAMLSEPSGYILKPFEERELSTAVEMALYKHQSDRQLREQREWLRVTLASIGDAVITCDTDCRVTFLNPIAEALTGWSTGEARDRPIQEVFSLINEQTRQPPEDPVALVLREGQVKALANHTALVTRDGREVPIEDSAAPILDADGQVIGVVLVFHDVTEKRRAHEALQESEARLQAANEELQAANEELQVQSEELQSQNQELARLWEESRRAKEALAASQERLSLALSSAAMGTFDWDIITNERIWDDNVHRLLGTNPKTFRGAAEEFFGIMLPEDRVTVQDALSKAIETTGNYETEYRAVWPDNTIRYIAAKGKVHKDRAGRAVRMTGICWDITERKLTEEALRRTKEEWERTFASVPDLIAILDNDHKVLRVNKAMARRLTHEPEECVGLHCYEAVHGLVEPPEFCPHTLTLKDGREHIEEVHEEHLRGDFLVSTTPLHDEHGKMIGSIHVAHDITERKRAEEELRQAKEAADAASQAKSQFLANMSHELRTPMTGVLGMLEFALNTTLDEQQQDLIETAHKSARTLLRILNDILDLAKVEAGKLSLEVKPFGLHECVAGAVDILVPEARRKSLELKSTVADDLPKTVVGDQVRLLQVLTNLLGNAVKYTERGQVNITVTSGSQSQAGKKEIIFNVADSGIGIPANKKEMIFQSFTQADESHTRKFGGVGLGLAISRELVERMGGTISCESKEGVGSTFSFSIPFGDDQTKSDMAGIPMEPLPVAGIPVSTEEREKARLLLAEDDPITRKVIGMMLQKSDFDIDIAEHGLQAVELWEKGNYDLILMDVQMPHMDGFAATSSIREKERENDGHTLIVAMTAHAFPEDEIRCRAAGMDAYISKPIDMKQCITLIEDLIGKRDLEA
jgi:PAS domain S-box-containing protein